MNNKTGQALKIILSFILAAVLVYFAFRSVDWKAFMGGLLSTDWVWVAGFFLFAIAALILRMFRWRAMLRPLDPEVKALDTWDAANIGNLVNVVLPGAGEFARCGYLVSPKAGYEKVLGTAFMERIWDVVAIAVLFILSLLLDWHKFAGFFNDQIAGPLATKMSFSLWWIVILFVALAAAGVFAVFKFRDRNKACGKIAEKIAGLGSGLGSFTKMERKWAFFLYTVGIWTMYTMMGFSILKAIPELSGLSVVDAIFISAVGNIASVIPVPGGIGAYHYLVALTLSSLYGASWEMGILFATLNHESHAILILILGAISYFMITARRRITKKLEKTD